MKRRYACTPLVLLLVLGAGSLQYGLASATARHPGRAGAPIAASIGVTGSLLTFRNSTAGAVLTVRLTPSDLRQWTVVGSRLRTAAGDALTAAQLRPGDVLARQLDGTVIDRSQRERSFTGVVSMVPLSTADPYIVQTSASGSVQVDASRLTQYSDASHETSSLRQIEEADMVRVRGVYDSVLAEFTRTDSVMRVGPLLQKSMHGGARHA